jgi:hypothetical protein
MIDRMTDCACLYGEMLWVNVSPRWRVILAPLWLTLPLFFCAAWLIERASKAK